MARTSLSTSPRRPSDSALAAEARRLAEDPSDIKEVKEILEWMDALRDPDDWLIDETPAPPTSSSE